MRWSVPVLAFSLWAGYAIADQSVSGVAGVAGSDQAAVSGVSSEAPPRSRHDDQSGSTARSAGGRASPAPDAPVSAREGPSGERRVSDDAAASGPSKGRDSGLVLPDAPAPGLPGRAVNGASTATTAAAVELPQFSRPKP